MNIILLSGGSGKRLWPLSNDVRSKQFIKLFKNEKGEYESMVQRVYRQITKVDPEAKVTIATSKSQASAIKNQLAAINLQASSQVVITKQPESVNAATGKQFILKVEAEGTNLKYKWQAQKTESGEWTDFRDTTQSLTRTMSSIYDGWKIRCIVTDIC